MFLELFIIVRFIQFRNINSNNTNHIDFTKFTAPFRGLGAEIIALVKHLYRFFLTNVIYLNIYTKKTQKEKLHREWKFPCFLCGID